MNRFILRIVAFFLISCLITDPATSVAANNPLSSTEEWAIQWRTWGLESPIFDQEALSNRGGLFPFNRFNRSTFMRVLSRYRTQRRSPQTQETNESEMPQEIQSAAEEILTQLQVHDIPQGTQKSEQFPLIYLPPSRSLELHKAMSDTLSRHYKSLGESILIFNLDETKQRPSIEHLKTLRQTKNMIPIVTTSDRETFDSLAHDRAMRNAGLLPFDVIPIIAVGESYASSFDVRIPPPYPQYGHVVAWRFAAPPRPDIFGGYILTAKRHGLGQAGEGTAGNDIIAFAQRFPYFCQFLGIKALSDNLVEYPDVEAINQRIRAFNAIAKKKGRSDLQVPIHFWACDGQADPDEVLDHLADWELVSADIGTVFHFHDLTHKRGYLAFSQSVADAMVGQAQFLKALRHSRLISDPLVKAFTDQERNKLNDINDSFSSALGSALLNPDKHFFYYEGFDLPSAKSLGENLLKQLRLSDRPRTNPATLEELRRLVEQASTAELEYDSWSHWAADLGSRMDEMEDFAWNPESKVTDLPTWTFSDPIPSVPLGQPWRIVVDGPGEVYAGERGPWWNHHIRRIPLRPSPEGRWQAIITDPKINAFTFFWHEPQSHPHWESEVHPEKYDFFIERSAVPEKSAENLASPLAESALHTQYQTFTSELQEIVQGAVDVAQDKGPLLSFVEASHGLAVANLPDATVRQMGDFLRQLWNVRANDRSYDPFDWRIAMHGLELRMGSQELVRFDERLRLLCSGGTLQDQLLYEAGRIRLLVGHLRIAGPHPEGVRFIDNELLITAGRRFVALALALAMSDRFWPGRFPYRLFSSLSMTAVTLTWDDWMLYILTKALNPEAQPKNRLLSLLLAWDGRWGWRALVHGPTFVLMRAMLKDLPMVDKHGQSSHQPVEEVAVKRFLARMLGVEPAYWATIGYASPLAPNLGTEAYDRDPDGLRTAARQRAILKSIFPDLKKFKNQLLAVPAQDPARAA